MRETTAIEVGRRIYRFRNANNMTQQLLAEMIGTTPQNISKYEKDGVHDIEVIQRLSEALGHNLLLDETDAVTDGNIGVIEKTVLEYLISGGGIADAKNALNDEFFRGLNSGKISETIFKLEEMGLCVREQSTGLRGDNWDNIYITAKGIMLARQLGIKFYFSFFTGDNEVKESIKVYSYEEIIKGYNSVQEAFDNMKNKRFIELAMQINPSNGYRINVIHSLKKLVHDKEFEMFETLRNEGTYTYDYVECEEAKLFPGEYCWSDILYSMMIGLDRTEADRIIRYLYYYGLFQIESDKDDEEREITDQFIREYEMDDDGSNSFGFIFDNVMNGNKNFSVDSYSEEKYGEYDSDKVTKHLSKKLYEKCLAEYEELSTLDLDAKSRYEKEKMNHSEDNYMKWFSDEEIKTFIEGNILEAKTEKEVRLEGLLQEIYKERPDWVDKYFEFPESWEKNGLADLARSKYGI